MKKFLLAAGLTLAAPAFAADVGVSIEISQPGVYGRIDMGRFPQPQVIVAQPIFVQQPTVVVQRPDPVYLWVPQELEEALPRLRRLRRTGVFRQARLVRQPCTVRQRPR